MRISDLNTGLERISRWNEDRPFPLPENQAGPVGYLPQAPAIDAVLGQKALDDRLAELLLPTMIDTSLLEPSVLDATRKEIIDNFRVRAETEADPHHSLFQDAVHLLKQENDLFNDVQSALAVLLQG